jgi:hypothetical protein
MANVPVLNFLAISAIEIPAMDCMAPSFEVVNTVNYVSKYL